MSSEGFSSSLGQLLAEIERLRSSATQMFIDSMDTTFPDRDGLSPEAKELYDLLRSARASMLKDPVGARALVAFLAAEGKRYAETEEGALWREALLGTPDLERLRELWETVSWDVFDFADEEDLIPTAWVDMLSDVLANRTDFEDLINALRPDLYR